MGILAAFVKRSHRSSLAHALRPSNSTASFDTATFDFVAGVDLTVADAAADADVVGAADELEVVVAAGDGCGESS